MNDIEVGALPADQYNSIVKMVRADRRLYVAQAFNYIGATWRLVALSLRYVPILWFLALIVLEVGAPSSVTDLIAAMRQATPAEINHAICWMLGIGCFVSMIIVALSMLLGGYPTGVVDQFDGKISHHIRSLLEVPAEGKMMVVVTTDSGQ
ncbi:hypothetical protein [Paraburkholderia fungorum]|uniref:hypothetical protein n=1 Tax=Paraburkholderia fungorum TaxID=134537 RepID=UPI000FDCB316|nr:hypothetical protein [Paraburkholderia fungorum]MBB5546691.1 hypothetical protein [Paraburkholderia fungorum]